MSGSPQSRSHAYRFIVLIGVLSLFGDFVYEGARGILGPYLALLGASGLAVGVVTGFGELAGYGIRLVSGPAADRTRAHWPITIAGYVVQMLAVPALALAGSWPAAAVLIVLERAGKAIRNPPRDVMLAHASRDIGYGKGFGLKEALDQTGALAGPLVIAAILARHGSYRFAFAVLLVPALVTLALVLAARLLYPFAAGEPAPRAPKNLAPHSRRFWVYLAGAGLAAAGLADFPLLAFHFEKRAVVSPEWIPILYAIAMGVAGLGAFVFGRLFDRRGLGILAPLSVVGAAYAPLAFLGGAAGAAAGAALWGFALGVHEAIIPAAVAQMVPPERRATAYGIFTASFGGAWFLGSALLGALYDASIPAMVFAAVVLELAAAPVFLRLGATAS